MMPQGHTCGLAHRIQVVPILVVAPIVVSVFQLHQHYLLVLHVGLLAADPQMKGEKQSDLMIGEKQSGQAQIHNSYAISLV